MDSTRLRGNYRNALTNPFDLMLRQADSLHLTTDQSDSIAVLNAQYNRFVDTTWSPIVSNLANLPDQYSLNDAWGKVLGGYDAIIAKLIILGPAAKKIFTTQQLALIPPTLAVYLDRAGILALRPGNANGLARVGGLRRWWRRRWRRWRRWWRLITWQSPRITLMSRERPPTIPSAASLAFQTRPLDASARAATLQPSPASDRGTASRGSVSISTESASVAGCRQSIPRPATSRRTARET